jgi:hypothetical protein
MRSSLPSREYLEDTSQQTSKTRHVITQLRTVTGITEQILPVRLDTSTGNCCLPPITTLSFCLVVTLFSRVSAILCIRKGHTQLIVCGFDS